MAAKVCYLGDDFLTGAAGYLAAIMLHYGMEFDYVPSAESPPEGFLDRAYALYAVSDYPARRFGQPAMRHVVECVDRGSGLLMLGGWESFFGRLGEYHESPLADALPVEIARADDRTNCAQPCLVEAAMEHPITAGLPWDRPPGIGGFNRFTPRGDAQVVLNSVQFDVRHEDERFQFWPGRRSPLLVVGQHGQGRTAALATDAAPHWVGGMVDWGDRRMIQEVAGAEVEVGGWYAQFFHQLLAWTGGWL
ncbi:MAG: glutamine amidotransferase [Thermoguttaceae bacterium]